MTRRVIFPDPDYWTTPKENATMTDLTTAPNPRDIRMAAALTIHHRNADQQGIADIVRDIAESDRANRLLEALLNIHMIVAVQLHTDLGIDYIRSQVDDIAAVKPVDPETMDIHRAALIFDGHARGDIDSVNDVLRQLRAEKRGTQTLIALLNIYLAVLPELSSTAGKQWLAACVASSHTGEATE